MWVLKSDGKKQSFDQDKLARSCLHSGAELDLALDIAKTVKDKIKEGESTAEIRQEVYELLLKSDPDAAKAYVSYKKIKR